MFDNELPRYLPHMRQSGILHMGLSPLQPRRWIETDNHWRRYHDHKLASRRQLGDGVYRALPSSDTAQRELAELLRSHLLCDQSDLYKGDREHATASATLHYVPESLELPRLADEPLWQCSLWVADDLVIMEKRAGEYHLSAASLCSPSDWRLDEKFDRPLAEIHHPVPGYATTLNASVKRFFDHLKPGHPVERWNWSLQVGDDLHKQPGSDGKLVIDAPVYYRSERQTLRRLPLSGAVAFTIRVYLHPLQTLTKTPGALTHLFAAIDGTETAMADYKGFGKLAPALEKYRKLTQPSDTLAH